MMGLLLNKYVITVLIVVVAGAVGIVSIKFLGNENPIEETAEKIIKDETGIDVELSQKAPETQVSAPVSSDTKTTPL